MRSFTSSCSGSIRNSISEYITGAVNDHSDDAQCVLVEVAHFPHPSVISKVVYGSV